MSQAGAAGLIFGPLMAYFPPFRFLTVCFLVIAELLLSGCCANNVCDCQDANEDAVMLRFSLDNSRGRGFAAADLDTLILVRSPLPYLPANKVETVTLYRNAAQTRDSVLLNHAAPFSQSGTTKLNRYRYEVRYLTHPPRTGAVTTVLVIDSVQLRGSFEGNGCCTCYANTRKTVFAKRPRRVGAAPDSAVVVDLRAQPALMLTK